jgi:hypothetical protein
MWSRHPNLKPFSESRMLVVRDWSGGGRMKRW